MAMFPSRPKPPKPKPDEEVDVDVTLGVIKVEVHHFFETPLVVNLNPLTHVKLTLTTP